MATKSGETARKSTKGSVEATVFVPQGPVPRDSIFKTAITAVRNQIPVIYTLVPEVKSVSDPKTVDGVKGRDYTITINYDTDVPGAEPVKLDQEIERLTVPSLSDFNVATQAAPVETAPPASDDPK